MRLENVAAVIAALVVVVAFFLPWMQGSNEFEHRSFSGFDFARLVRNFEITAGSPSGLGQIRATAIALYLVPALALNAVIFSGLASAHAGSHRVAGVTAVLAGAYGIGVLGVLLLFSVLPVTALADVIGPPSYGFAGSAAVALVMGLLGIRASSRRG